MIDYGTTRSTIRPDSVVIDDSSVWVHSNITEITVPDIETESSHTEYQFRMVQYAKDEYIKLMDVKNSELEDQLTDAELALVELYELIGG